MSRPRHLGSSPSLNRSLSRLSSSSSFQVRQSNSRFYTFLLVAGALVLFATVALLQLKAPLGASKLSPLENTKNGKSADEAMGGLESATGKGRIKKLGRKIGAVRSEEEVTDEETGDDDDEDVEQDLFDIDIDDRLLDEEETEDPEDVELTILGEVSNEEDSDERAANGNAIPDWVLDSKSEAGLPDRGFERDLVKDLEKPKGSFFWSHALGIPKRAALENVEHVENEDTATAAVAQLRGFKEVVQNWRERFNSDDELVDENVEERLEDVREIEDALLLTKVAPSNRKLGGYLKKGRLSSFDAMNPANNPMLQDPDTDAGTWMTKTDKEMLRALRGDRLLRGSNIHDVSQEDSVIDEKQDKGEKKNSEINGTMTSQSKEGERYSYPGIAPSLSFLEFLEAFLGQESCSVKVFMVWATPAWGFTARHQRVLESLLRFHRNACVAILSDTLELGIFNSFVTEGYKVAVVRPNVQELLAETPCDVFTAVLPKWKEKPLFHVHYSELLRLAALYKFGGVYLDMDMLVLRPLDTLHNTVGSEITTSGELRLNGALLAFDKSSLFLKKCMEEFTRTYDETSLEYNGADLLTRVANSTVDDEGSAWTQFPSLLKIQGPFTFFPLDSSGISRFFAAPKDDNQKQQQGQMLTRISEEAYTIHLWNSLTSNLVPEVNSLVGVILNRSCLRCKDVL